MDSVGPGGKADLPNDDMTGMEHDTRTYGEIANHFGEHGFSLETDLKRLDPMWPIEGDRRDLLTRFGTPVNLGGFLAYFHSALDVLRDDSQSAAVLAPFDGVAMVFGSGGTTGFNGDPYRTTVAVWDSESHVIAQLMHVDPADRLLEGPAFVEVRRGEVLGELANIGGVVDRLRHTHVSLTDGGSQLVLNPARHFDYRDAVAPTILGLYALDANANMRHSLATGRLDLVVEAFDRDDDSRRNFEINSMEYRVTDDQGRVLLHSLRCHFDELLERIDTGKAPALEMIDFGNAAHQVNRGEWPNGDLDDRDRTFRYVVTQFSQENGRCNVVKDADGFLDIGDEVQELTVHVRVWDSSENLAESSLRLPR